MVDIWDTPEGRDILKIIEDGLIEVARSKKPQRDIRRPVTQPGRIDTMPLEIQEN